MYKGRVGIVKGSTGQYSRGREDDCMGFKRSHGIGRYRRRDRIAPDGLAKIEKRRTMQDSSGPQQR